MLQLISILSIIENYAIAISFLTKPNEASKHLTVVQKEFYKYQNEQNIQDYAALLNNI